MYCMCKGDTAATETDATDGNPEDSPNQANL